VLPLPRTFRRRIHGSANRILWRSEDIARIAHKSGMTSEAVASRPAALPTMPIKAPAFRGAADPSRTYTWTISTGDIDRSSDTLSISGWKLSNFRANPVVLWSHQSGLVPIGRATRTWVEGPRLKSTVQLAETAIAEEVKSLTDGGFLLASSVGFLPISFKFSDDPARGRLGIDFLSQDLAEWSIVSVPANPHCLIDPVQTGSTQSPADNKQNAEQRLRAAARKREIERIIQGTL
jgi:hypothetical protein